MGENRAQLQANNVVELGWLGLKIQTNNIPSIDIQQTIMLTRPIFSFLPALLISLSSAMAADINTATRAEIEAVRGVGVVLTDRIIEQRKIKPFQSWQDAQKRVRGLGKRNVAGFRDADMRINGQLPEVDAKDKPAKVEK